MQLPIAWDTLLDLQSSNFADGSGHASVSYCIASVRFGPIVLGDALNVGDVATSCAIGSIHFIKCAEAQAGVIQDDTGNMCSELSTNERNGTNFRQRTKGPATIPYFRILSHHL